MDRNSAMSRLMESRVDSVLDGIVMADEEYCEAERRGHEYLEKLEVMQQTEEARKLLDRCICEHNAGSSRYGRLAYLLGFSDCMELVLGSAHLRP